MKKRHEKRLHPTAISNTSVRVNYTYYNDGSIRLSGYLVNAKNGIRLDCDIHGTAKAKSPSQLKDKEKYLIGRLTAQYQNTVKAKPSVALSEEPFSQAFDSLSNDQQLSLCPFTWNSSRTRGQGLAYFQNTMLPLLDKYGIDIDAKDLSEVIEEMKNRAAANGNSKGNPYITEQKIKQHLKDFNVLYGRLRVLCPDYALPEIEFPVPSSTRKYQAEQCKALPLSVIIRFAATLMDSIQNGLAMGGVLMLTSMVRTSEACAPKFKDIILFDKFAVYGVLWQSDGTVVIPDLKSDASYRIIVLPKYALDAIKARKAYLRDLGFTDEEIKAMPVVSLPDDPTKPAPPNKLSAYIREQLSNIYCTDEYWQAAEATMLIEKDMEYDGKTASTDVSAYILRRNGCTMACNYCGMPPDLVDALMGHKLSKYCKEPWDHYIRRPDNWPTIAECLERFIYDPRHSANPAFDPIPICADTHRQIDLANASFSLMADPSGEEIEVCITVESLEPNDSIRFSSTAKADVRSFLPPSTYDNRPTLGPIYEEAFYEQYIKAAKEQSTQQEISKIEEENYE